MTITLSEQERQALRVLSEREMRLPRDQVRYILHRELVQARLLPDQRITESQKETEQGAANGPH